MVWLNPVNDVSYSPDSFVLHSDKITEPLSQETALALEELCPADDDQGR